MRPFLIKFVGFVWLEVEKDGNTLFSHGFTLFGWIVMFSAQPGLNSAIPQCEVKYLPLQVLYSVIVVILKNHPDAVTATQGESTTSNSL